MDTTITDAEFQHSGVGLSAPLRLPGETDTADTADASLAEHSPGPPTRRNIFRRSRTPQHASDATETVDGQADTHAPAVDAGSPAPPTVPTASEASEMAGPAEASAAAASPAIPRSRRGRLLATAALVSVLGAAGAGAWVYRDRIAAFDWQTLSPQAAHLPPSVVRVFDQVRHAVPLAAPQADAPHTAARPAPAADPTAARPSVADPVLVAKTTPTTTAKATAEPHDRAPAGAAPAGLPASTASADLAEVAALKSDGPHPLGAAPPATTAGKTAPDQPAASLAPAPAAQAKGPSEQGMPSVGASEATPNAAAAGAGAGAGAGAPGAAVATPLRLAQAQTPPFALAFALPEPAKLAPSAAELQAATRALAPPATRPLPVARSATPAVTEADLQHLRKQQVSLTDMLNEAAAQLSDTRTEVASLRTAVAKLSKQVERSTNDFEARIGLNETALTLLKSKAALPPPGEAATEAALGTPAATTPQAAPPAVHHVAAPAALSGIPKPEHRTLKDYVVKGASPGMAVLSALNPATGNPAPIEVTVGDTVPGLGRVRSIAQRGTSWVVTTDGGVIEH